MCRYKTKMTIEVVVDHQFAPESGIYMVTGLLEKIPAIQSVKIMNASSNHALHNEPMDSMEPISLAEVVVRGKISKEE